MGCLTPKGLFHLFPGDEDAEKNRGESVEKPSQTREEAFYKEQAPRLQSRNKQRRVLNRTPGQRRRWCV